jgi:hypothetical protein
MGVGYKYPAPFFYYVFLTSDFITKTGQLLVFFIIYTT